MASFPGYTTVKQIETRSQGLMAHLIYLNSYEINLSDLSHSQICQRVRSVICEAVWEAVRVRLSESPKCRGRSERPCGRPIGLSRTAGDAVRSSAKCIALAGRDATGPVCVRGRSASHMASHFGLSDRSHDFVRPICEAVRVRSDSTGQSNAFSREISQIAPRIGLSAGVRERPIGLRAKQCV